MECVELAPASKPPHALRQRQQAGRTPYASRSSSSTRTFPACEHIGLRQCDVCRGKQARNDCQARIDGVRKVRAGSSRLAGKRIELLDPGRLGAASAPHKGCNLLGAAAFIRVQGEMQKRGLARWVGEQQRLEEKRQKPLESE